MTAIGRLIFRAVVAAGATTALTLSLASTATAATPRNGICEAGEFCLYWGRDFTESVSDFNTSIPDYGETQPTCYEFRGPGRGQFTCVKNNAVSAWNRTSGTVRLYVAESCEGARRWVIPANSSEPDLSPLANMNQSHSLASSGAC